MAVAIIGASGLLGRAVKKEFEKEFDNVIGTGFSRTEGTSLVKLDITRREAISRFFDTHRKLVAVVNCAAERRPDVAEKNKDAAHVINVTAAGWIAEECAKNNIWYCYISTDYVFDGKNPPYDVDSVPCPLNVYGESKVAGEKACLLHYPEATILRVPILYGETETYSESAVKCLIPLLQDSSKKVVMDDFQIRYPTNVSDVGRVLVQMVHQAKEIKGVYHFCGKEKMTKYDMCKIIAGVMKADISHLEPLRDLPVNAMNEIDPTVWIELPEDIRSELLKINASAHPPLDLRQQGATNAQIPIGFDKRVWESLPEDVQFEQLESQIAPIINPVNNLTHEDAIAEKPQSFRALHFFPTILQYRIKSGEIDWIPSKPPTVEIDPCLVETPTLSSNDGLWVDSAFPPNVSSIDGIRTLETPAATSPSSTAVSSRQKAPLCKCIPPKPARLKTVFKENKNHGRKFYGCCNSQQSSCSFFLWAPETGEYALQHSVADSAIVWERLQSCTLVHTEGGFKPEHVRQGRVGDCWVLSALAVIAEQPDLVQRLLPEPVFEHERLCGAYRVRLFIDGKWREYCVDNYFAIADIKAQKYSPRNSEPGPRLYFAKAAGTQIWVSVIEKAYAKAHSSYRSISGGHIAEALFDLTGFPTETVCFGGAGFDSEIFWTRMVSFHSQKFLMGACCPHSGAGLIGGHAYSILQVVEESIESNFTLGKTSTLEDYFDSRNKRKFNPDDDVGVTEHGTLRLIKLRNPWGNGEWKGTFGVDSSRWSSSLRKRLHVDGDAIDQGGVFWMSYHDFLQRFSQVDICFTLRSHQIASLECMLPRNSPTSDKVIEILVPDPSWINISLCQRTKRGKSAEDFYYTDLSVLILGIDDTRPILEATVEELRLFGQGRDAHFDLFLGERDCVKRYAVVAFSVERELAIREARVSKRGMTRIGSGEYGGRSLDLKKIEFSVRIMGANPFYSSEKFVSATDLETLVWDGLERSIFDVNLVSRSFLCGSPNEIFRENLQTPKQLKDNELIFDSHWIPEQYTLRAVESRGVVLVTLINRNQNTWLKVRLNLRSATQTSSSTVASVFRIVPPTSRRIVGVLVCPSSEGVLNNSLVTINDIEWISFTSKPCECNEKGKNSTSFGNESTCQMAGLFSCRGLKSSGA